MTQATPHGKIMLVGLGPGSHDYLTGRARAAIAEADTVIGYATYIKLVKELLDGKEVIKKAMTEELDRAIEAYDRAKHGKKVALVSSGDAGVYGMAGPTYEVLFQAGWTPEDHVAVEIVPGASAINACAALVGAPLTHDFCSISLSDLLTPWPVIARRLDAAAAADFVVAFYNPKSGRRTRQIVEAQAPLLHRAGLEVLDQHIALGGQAAHVGAALLGAQVERDALLVAAVDLPEQGHAVFLPLAQRIAVARRLDLDDLGTEVGQLQAQHVAGDDAAQVENAHAVQRAAGIGPVGARCIGVGGHRSGAVG